MTEVFTKTEFTLLQALEQERELVRERDVVSGMVVHEIAIAMTALGGGLELMKDIPPHLQASIDRITAGVATLQQMLDGLRMLLGGPGNPPAFETRDFPAFVHSVIMDPVLTDESSLRRIEMVVRLRERQQTFCPALLRHALSNLVSNALRYTPGAAPIRVIAGGRGDSLWVHVLNEGPKIPYEVVINLYQPRKKGAKGGMGFGLHIARECALRSGGWLTHGTTRRATVFSIVFGRLHRLLREKEATADRTERTRPDANWPGAVPESTPRLLQGVLPR